MKTFVFAGFSLVFALSVQGHAFAAEESALEEGTSTLADETQVNEALEGENAAIAALPTDEAVGAVIEAQANEADQTADQAVQAGTMTPAQAQDVHAAAANAREVSKKKGFRKKLLGALKRVGHDLTYLAKPVGYAGEAVGVAWITPIYAGTGFTAGLISGNKSPSRNPARAAFVVGSVGGGIGTEVLGLDIAAALPGEAIAFPVSVGVLAANHLAVGCNVWKNNGEYCENIGKIDAGMTDGALKGSRKGGAKVHNFFLKVFKHKHS